MESSFIKAYKSIESVIGEPSKDLNKIKRKLLARGIDPKTLIDTHREESTLAAEILRLRLSRKNKAHGWMRRKRKRTTDPFEVKDIQNVAKTVLLLCIQQRRKDYTP